VSFDYGAAYDRSRTVADEPVKGVHFLMKKNAITVWGANTPSLAVDLRRLQPADVLTSDPRSLLLRASGIIGRRHRRTIKGR